MVDLFGSAGIIGPITLLFGAIYALGGLIFRKSVANDMFDMPFSFIGCMSASMLAFILLDNLVGNMKITFIVSLVAWLAGGFALGPVMFDGEAGE